MKKVFAMILAVTLTLGCSPFVFAAERDTQDEDYHAAVAKIMTTYQEDPDAAKAALAELDTVLLEEPIIQGYSGDRAVTRGIDPTDYDLSVYAFKRGGSAIYYLQWLVKSNRDEWFEATLDYVSLEWNAKMASYYASNGDGVISTVRDRNIGIVLFNVQDGDLDKGESTYGTVEVMPSGRGTMEFGSKYVHTYTGVDISAGTASYSFSPSASLSASGEMSLGIAGNYGFSVTVTGRTKKWQIWADNALYL